MTSQTGWLIGGVSALGLLAQATSALAEGAFSSAKQAPASSLIAQEPLSPSSPMAQVTGVADLADVAPTDWAYQALQSLIERYEVQIGYPDGTFRGDRALTRYEFAAGLNEVLGRIEDLIAGGEEARILREDISTLQRLQAEYGVALSSLSDRLTDLDNRTDQLEANQFSTTTQLQGEAILAVTNGINARSTVVSRIQLDLLTSFTPGDLLLTQLELGNSGADAISRTHNIGPNLLGTTGLLADGGGLEYQEADTDVRINQLYYTFRPVDDLAVTVGARMEPSDFIDRNRFANNPAVDFSSSFFTNNPLIVQNQIDLPGGAGVALDWNPNGGPFSVRSLYVAADADDPINGGLFRDRYQGSVELEYAPKSDWAVRLQYTTAEINNVDIEAGGINLEWAISRTTGLFGRYGFGSYEGFSTALTQPLDLDPQSWMVGLTLRNFFIPGSLAGVAIGQPFVESSLGDATQTNYELFYNLALNDHLSITPTLMLVTNADNNDASDAIWQGTLRTVFSF